MPWWEQAFEAGRQYLEDAWFKLLILIAVSAGSWWLGRRRAAKQWQDREFLDRLNVSLTRIDGGTLKIRTLLEKPAVEVFLNKQAAASVREAAGRTTEADPVLPLPEEDRWFYLNAVLNEVSEQFAAGQVRAELGHDVRRADFLIALTCERAGEVRTQKVRAMVVRVDLLTKLPEKRPKLESSNHATRWKTLQTLAKRYAADPESFLRVEVCL